MTTVLVIDDEPLVAELVQAAEPSWTILATPDGVIGLDLLRQRRSEDVRVDLIILDIHMPGMDGYDTCLQLRTAAPSVPILPFTNLQDDWLLSEYMRDLHCAPVLYKHTTTLTGLSAGMRAALADAVPPRGPQRSSRGCNTRQPKPRNAHGRLRSALLRLRSMHPCSFRDLA